jgi:hypothetical protein
VKALELIQSDNMPSESVNNDICESAHGIVLDHLVQSAAEHTDVAEAEIVNNKDKARTDIMFDGDRITSDVHVVINENHHNVAGLSNTDNQIHRSLLGKTKSKRRKGKRRKHILTMPAKRRVRPVRRLDLHQPEVNVSKRSEQNVTGHSIRSADNHAQSMMDSLEKYKKKRQHTVKKAHRACKPYPRRESIFYTSDHPDTQANTMDATQVMASQRESKHKDISGNVAVAFM